MEEQSREPTANDLLLLCAELNRLEAKYLLIGGVAMNMHGLIRTTEDIDLLIEESLENQIKVKQALRILPDKAIEELGSEDIRDFVVVRVNDEITVDLMTQACGVTFDSAERSSGIELRTVEGVAIPVGTREFLIQTKQGIREKDKIDLRFLLKPRAQTKTP